MRSLAVIVLVALASAVACGSSATGIQTANLDRVLTVATDGSLEIADTWTVTFGTKPETEFDLGVRHAMFDDVASLTATIDGAPAPDGRGPGHVEIRDGDPIVIIWRFPATANGTRTLAMHLAVTGALAAEGAHGSLRWPLLPAKRDFVVRDAHVRLVVPASMPFVGSAGVEPDRQWSLHKTTDGLEASKRDVPSDENVALAAELIVDPRLVDEPHWQERAREALTLMPAFLAGGAFLLVVGAGVLWMIRLQYPAPERPGAVDKERAWVKHGLRDAGTTVIALGAVGFIVVPLTLGYYGPWPLALPLAVTIVGVAFMFQGAKFDARGEQRK